MLGVDRSVLQVTPNLFPLNFHSFCLIPIPALKHNCVERTQTGNCGREKRDRLIKFDHCALICF